MSLLMDALRKAEEAKRAAAAAEGGPASEAQPATEVAPELPLAPPVAAQASSLDELTLAPIAEAEPAPVQAEPASASPRRTAAPPPRQADTRAQESTRATVQNAFAVKQAAAGSRNFIIAVTALGLLAAIGIGIWFWLQLQPKKSSLVPMVSTSVQASPPPSFPAAALPTPAPAPLVAAAPAPAVAPTSGGNSSPTVDLFRTEKAPDAEAPLITGGPKSPLRPARGAAPVRFAASKSGANQQLNQGYDALQAGNLGLAQQSYERALAGDPRNSDALYGLAAVAIQKNQPGVAEDYYLKLLEIDPRDAIAHAGLAGLRGKAAGANTESRLKSLMAEQPGVAALPFALGNLYAREERWRDAQAAYFLAYKSDSDNPDIVFNLAVSLDQLRQPKLAAQYYDEALRLTAGRPSGFSPAAAQARLRELQAMLTH